MRRLALRIHEPTRAPAAAAGYLGKYTYTCVNVYVYIFIIYVYIYIYAYRQIHE